MVPPLLLNVPLPEYGPRKTPPAETLIVPWFCKFPVYQVLAALLTLQMEPADRMMVSSE